jgi:hypothetical protein
LNATLAGKSVSFNLTDSVGNSVAPELASLSELGNVDYPSVLQPVSGVGGFITTALQFAYLSNVTGLLPSSLHVQFVVDGVLSPLSAPVVAPPASANTGCSAILLSASVRCDSQLLLPYTSA